MTRVVINTEVEMYPMLGINPDDRGVSDIEVPAAMLDRLTAAIEAEQRAETEIMRYVAEHYPDFDDAARWLRTYGSDAP